MEQRIMVVRPQDKKEKQRELMLKILILVIDLEMSTIMNLIILNRDMI